MQPPPASGPIRQLTDVASLALEEARRQGASQCEADASLAQGLSVSVRLREVDTLEYQRDRGLGVTVYFGQRKGSASTADLTAAAVRETVEKACAIARYTAEDPYAGLVEPEALAREIPTSTRSRLGLAPERAIELARECEAAGLVWMPALPLRGRIREQSAQHGCLRQLARLSRRLRGHQPLDQLLAHRASRR